MVWPHRTKQMLALQLLSHILHIPVHTDSAANFIAYNNYYNFLD